MSVSGLGLLTFRRPRDLLAALRRSKREGLRLLWGCWDCVDVKTKGCLRDGGGERGPTKLAVRGKGDLSKLGRVGREKK